MKFSKHHNLYNDEAAKRRKFRELLGGAIMVLIITVFSCVIMEAIYITAARQAQFNMGPVK